jgi:hypothetical protein
LLALSSSGLARGVEDRGLKPQASMLEESGGKPPHSKIIGASLLLQFVLLRTTLRTTSDNRCA